MKLFASACLLLTCVSSLFSQSKAPVLIRGLGDHHHAISTNNPDAQRFFDQGLSLVFGFNHEEAVRAFRRSAELDPHSAMAFWGIALALGPCINLDVDPPHEKAAYEAVQKALLLASGATKRERDYIQALARRYSSNPNVDLRKLDAEYAVAMRELSKSYPDDLDAATLYAESLMDLHPWKLWSLDGRPTEGTEEIIAVLESVLRRDPNHIGANHYFIHATEASPHPEWALASARRLETLAPGAGHLVHMPAHVYMRVGDYWAAAQSNAVGADADRSYLR
jgi:tetratricopeptide (TPR) repeat protein